MPSPSRARSPDTVRVAPRRANARRVAAGDTAPRLDADSLEKHRVNRATTRRDVAIAPVAPRRLARLFEIAFDGSLGERLAPRFDGGERRLGDARKAKQLAIRRGDVRG